MAFLILLAVFLIAAAWAIVARPRVIYLALAAAEIGLFLWQAGEFREASLVAQVLLGTFEDYAVDTSPGDHAIRIRELRNVSGLQVRPIPKPGAAPPSRLELESCLWRIEGYPITLPGGPTEGAIHEFTSETWGLGTSKHFTLSYHVSEQSRPTLERIASLRAQLPYERYHDTFIAEYVCRMLRFWCFVLAGVGLAGLLSQSICLLMRFKHRAQEQQS